MSWYKKASVSELSERLEQSIKELVSSVNLDAACKSVLHPCPCSKATPKRKIGKIGDFTIFIVNGDVVKTQHEMEFIEGGNDKAYSSETDPDHRNVIPRDEIWISAEIRSQFLPYILLHEILEATLMEETGSDYATAHDTANFYEKRARTNKIFG